MKENENSNMAALGFFALIIMIAYMVYLTNKNAIAQPIQTISVPQNSSDGIIATTEIRPTTAHAINHHLNQANHWYAVPLSRTLKNWQLKARGDYDLLYAFSPTHQNYFTLSSGDTLTSATSPNADINAIYLMCETDRVVAEILTWEK